MARNGRVRFDELAAKRNDVSESALPPVPDSTPRGPPNLLGEIRGCLDGKSIIEFECRHYVGASEQSGYPIVSLALGITKLYIYGWHYLLPNRILQPSWVFVKCARRPPAPLPAHQEPARMGQFYSGPQHTKASEHSIIESVVVRDESL